jgi:hypothetical protein
MPAVACWCSPGAAFSRISPASSSESTTMSSPGGTCLGLVRIS